MLVFHPLIQVFSRLNSVIIASRFQYRSCCLTGAGTYLEPRLFQISFRPCDPIAENSLVPARESFR